MNALPAEMPLTRGERLFIALTIPAIAVLVRLILALLSSALIGNLLRNELMSLTFTIAVFIPFPLAVSAMVRAVAMRSRAMEIAVLVVFSFTGALISYLWWRHLTMPDDPEEFVRWGWIHLRLYAPAVAVFLSLTASFIAAVHQYRIAIADDARRFEAEAESARRARQSLEQRIKPGMVVADLQSIAARATSDPDGAEHLLLRLARRQRLLLRKTPSEPGPHAPLPHAVEDDRAIPPLPSLPFIYPLLIYLIAVIAFDLDGIDWQPRWSSTIMTLLSAACWLAVGPALDRLIRAAVRFRLPVAIAAALTGVIATALFVTAVSVAFVHAVAEVSVRELVEWNLSVMAWRNALPALVVAANALMTAYFDVMLAARAAAARAVSETVRTETRALEDRFHPHFLFNALNSIVAFIREDRAAAARMCLQLAALVERTVAFAGVRWWAVENELDLIAEYLSIQRIRFGGRLEIDRWDVPADVRKKPIPRLILQPLIENIFKHAVATSPRPIHAGLAIRKCGGGIEISLWNSVVGVARVSESGRGLAFVSGRIRDAGGTLAIDDGAAAGRFSIRCYIPPHL